MKYGNPAWTRRNFLRTGLAATAAAAAARRLGALDTPAVTSGINGGDSLRAHAESHGLLFGAAVVPSLLDVDGVASGNTTDPYTQLIWGQANIVVAENAMKWGPLRPTPTGYDFSEADRLMKFAGVANQKVRGHNLCWHEQLPDWFKTTATKDNAKQILVSHIQTVAGRYKGKIHSWDVVNEAVLPKDGRADGLRKTPWLDLLGPEYIELAFQTAAAADPAAKLTYNDYNIELDTPEHVEIRAQLMLLLRRLKARNVPIHAVGLQSHLQGSGPQAGAGLKNFIRDLKKMDLEVYVTEMDVNTRGVDGGPAVQDEAVAKVYRDYLGLVLAEPNVKAALTWGITNKHTWLNETKSEWAQRKDGSRQRPLPFDDDLRPTEAFEAIREAIDASRTVTRAARMPSEIDAENLYQPFAVPGSPVSQSSAVKTYVPPPR